MSPDTNPELSISREDAVETYSVLNELHVDPSGPIEGLSHSFTTNEAAELAGFSVNVVFGSDLLRPLPSGKSTLEGAVERYGVDRLASVRHIKEDGDYSNVYSIFAKPLEVAPKRTLGSRLLGRIATRD